MKRSFYFFVIIVFHTCISAVELSTSGLLDARVTSTDGINSYLQGYYGKFRYADGSDIALAQGTLKLKADWTEHLSTDLVINAYAQDEDSGLGLTEAFIQYKTLPSANGYRYKVKAGMLYPKVSLNNNGLGWSSPHTLSYSMMNSWLGEEVRHLGFYFEALRLGKLVNSDHDFGLGLDVFRHNDTSGALLAWHGWTMSSQQTLWQEQIPLPEMMARNPGQPLATQAPVSEPFIELDHRSGYHLSGQWRWQRRLRVAAGYYDNRTKPYVLRDGQYGWHTTFRHIGFHWRLHPEWTVIAQYMIGDTLMQNSRRQDVVNNAFSSGYLLASYRNKLHRWSFRIDFFDVDDRDNIQNDNNFENGHGETVNYQYTLSQGWFLLLEYNRINSVRPSREQYMGLGRLEEQQFQLALRWYF